MLSKVIKWSVKQTSFRILAFLFPAVAAFVSSYPLLTSIAIGLMALALLVIAKNFAKITRVIISRMSPSARLRARRMLA